uniref:Uncharacterized protein n=1 Tax=Tanacetum cinerariifolium TaxID=118510 RepID=A0A6L2J5U2_TANCI|nr:hypothetical protein [Tanacetum cinerariifolium]
MTKGSGVCDCRLWGVERVGSVKVSGRGGLQAWWETVEHLNKILDVATLAIEKNVTKSLETVILTISSSQPPSLYEAAATLSGIKLTKILIDIMEKNKSCDVPDYKRELYDALVKSYNTNKDILESYGEVFSLKRSQDDKDKDQDPSAGLDCERKRRKSSKDDESSLESRSKEKKSSRVRHEDNDEQPADKEVTKADWLTNLTIDERYDLNVALHMYTRRMVIQWRVEDLQLCVESYQKKLKLTKPDTYRSNLRNKTAYTSYSDPHGIIYVDQNRRKRLMRTYELYKFSDGTLNDVWSALHDINQKDIPRDIPLDIVVVLRYEKRSKSENKGKVLTEIELVLEQTQQGTSYEVSVSVEGVEELKRKVKIKGEKKEALLTLRRKPSIHKDGHGGQSVKVKELQERCVIKAFKLSYRKNYEQVVPKDTRSQEGKRSQDNDKRLCLVDYLKEFKITFISSQSLNLMITTLIHKLKIKVKDYDLKTKAPGVVKLEIGGNVNFEMKSQFMRELREDTFFRKKNDDAHDHVERVLDIVSLFNIPGVSHDVVMLRIFPNTLTGAAKRLVERIPPGTVDSYDLFKKAFIQRKVKYGEFSRPFPNNRYDGRFNKGGYDQPSSREKRPSLTEIINKYMEEASKRQAEKDEWLMKFFRSTEASQETHDKLIQGLEGKVKTLANEVERRANNKKFEECKTIYSKNRLPLYTPFYYSPEEIKYFSANFGFSDNEEQETNDSGMAEAVAALKATLKKKREEPKTVKQNVNYYRERFEDEEDDLEEYLEDLEECGEDKANTILGVIHDKLNNDLFNNTSEDEDDLEGIMDYLKPRSYDGFIDLDDKACNKRRCGFLRMTYEEPTPSLIEKAKVV